MKTVTLYRPFNVENTLGDLDRYMEAFFGESPLSPANRNFPVVDIRETEEGYQLEAELPGYDEKSIQIQVDGRVLSIESKREEKTDQEDKNFIVRERRSESFCRSFDLPENADSESIRARFENGLLSLEIGKKAEAKKRLIEIAGK